MFTLSNRGLCKCLIALLYVASYAAFANEAQELVPVEELNVAGDVTSTVTQVQPQTASNNQQFSLELLGLIERLQQELAQLRGQVEELNYKVGKTDTTQKDRYVDLDRRLSSMTEALNTVKKNQASLNAVAVSVNTTSSANRPSISDTPAVTDAVNAENANTAASTSTANVFVSDILPNAEATAATQPTDDDPTKQQAHYKTAFNLIRNKRYPEAVTALRQFVEDYPRGLYTANAYYWLGEVYLVEDEPALALNSFALVVDEFPQHRKISDALYKMARAFTALGEQDKANALLDKVIAEHPLSSAAQLARQLQQ